MNLAQGLDALEKLANTLKLEGGMEGWERLSRQLEEGDNKKDIAISS